MNDTYKTQVRGLLKKAGIKINGKNDWDIQVHNEKLYRRALAHGSLGVGEAYMDKWWDATDLEELFKRALRLNLHTDLTSMNKVHILKNVALAKLANSQSITRSFKNVHHHYDLGNDLYETMLGRCV